MVAMSNAEMANVFRIRGDIDSNGALEVPPGSVVEGAVHARRILVAGAIQGPVNARERVVVVAGGLLDGPIKAGMLDIQEGGSCRGECRVGRRSTVGDDPPPVGETPQVEKWFWQQ